MFRLIFETEKKGVEARAQADYLLLAFLSRLEQKRLEWAAHERGVPYIYFLKKIFDNTLYGFDTGVVP